LTVLNAATQRELQLVIDNDSPNLIFARSSELLAMHLLLIQREYQDQLVSLNYEIVYNNDIFLGPT
jgi:hypothetical protein